MKAFFTSSFAAVIIAAFVSTSFADIPPQPLFQWGSLGSSPGQFDQVKRLAIDVDGNVYSVEHNNHRVQKFTSNGQFISTWGSFGFGLGQFNLPTGIACDNFGHVFVADYDNNRIQKFTSDGTFISVIGEPGDGPGQLRRPNGLACDASGNIYVADSGYGYGGAHHRIQKFSNDGDFILLWGGFGSNPGEFSFPVDVALSPDGQEVYVADYGNQRVQRFSNNGIFLSSWNGGNQTFGGPQGVEVDSFGNVYVVDLSYSTIQKFSATGSFICSWGSPVELNQPLDVSASTTGLFYVPNYEKITVYGEAPTPATPTTWSAIKAQYK